MRTKKEKLRKEHGNKVNVNECGVKKKKLNFRHLISNHKPQKISLLLSVPPAFFPFYKVATQW